MFLITDDDHHALGALTVEADRWVARDTAGRTLYSRVHQDAAEHAAQRYGHLVPTYFYGLYASSGDDPRSRRDPDRVVLVDQLGLLYVPEPMPMYVTACCAAPVTIFTDDGSLYCKGCFADADHRLLADPQPAPRTPPTAP
jgi:hypothetical protein